MEREEGRKGLTGCSPANSRMFGYEQKVQKSSSYSFYKAGCLSSSSEYTEEVGSNASEGMDLPTRARAKQAKIPSTVTFVYRLPTEVMTQIRDRFFQFK